jgi:hypothetical protein
LRIHGFRDSCRPTRRCCWLRWKWRWTDTRKIVTLASDWAWMNGAKFQFGARFTFESWRTDAPVMK